MSGSRARTSAIRACGSIPFIFAVTIRVYMTAARSPPRSEPAKSHDFRPNAIPLGARSAAGLVRQMRPSSGNAVKAAHSPCLATVSGGNDVIDGLGRTVVFRELCAFLQQPVAQAFDPRAGSFQPNDQAGARVLAVDVAPDVEDGIAPLHGLRRDGRDIMRRFAITNISGDVGQPDEFPPRMAPA